MSLKNRLIKWLRPFDSFWDHIRRYLHRRKGPVQLMAYRGFGSTQKIWLKGRVLEDRSIVARIEDSTWRNFVNTYKRFNSREIWGAELEVRIEQESFRLKTDREGYFELETDSPKSFRDLPTTWIHPEIELIRTPWSQINQQLRGEVLFPKNPSFGIISDIDDTIIRTGVTSKLMWRAIYRTILKNAGSRVIFKEVSAFFRALSQSPEDSSDFNPVFYVSNSPWNLYDLIDDFLRLNHLPKGPILLRDLGLPIESRPDGYKGHKYEMIARIFRFYPELGFVLIGDSGERDTDIYLDLMQHFPGRVKAIYIRDVQNKERTQRIRELIQNSGLTQIKLLTHFGEVTEHAEALGLLSQKIYDQLLKS